MMVPKHNRLSWVSDWPRVARGWGFSLGAVVMVWAIASAIVGAVAPIMGAFVPSPLRVLSTLWDMLHSSDFWKAFLASNFRVLAGFIVASFTAIPLGVVAGANERVSRLLAPAMDFGRYVPVAAMVPVLILWAGVGDLQKILVLAIGTFFQIFVLVADAVRRVPQTHVDSARTLGVRRSNLVLRVHLPASAPEIFDACRVGLGLTWSYLLVAEVVAAQQGLGYIIIRSQRFLQMDRIFVTIIVLGVLGLLYDRVFTSLRTPLFPWAARLTK